jgi:transcriptional regulator with XRE-family HTH domain
MATPPTFAELLHRHRLAARLTQEQLAERAGMSVRGLSDLERGERHVPQQAILRHLVTALGLAAAAEAFSAVATRQEQPRFVDAAATASALSLAAWRWVPVRPPSRRPARNARRKRPLLLRWKQIADQRRRC